MKSTVELSDSEVGALFRLMADCHSRKQCEERQLQLSPRSTMIRRTIQAQTEYIRVLTKVLGPQLGGAK